eukprot:7227427-Karenia_brevis.AAC.1
MGPQHQFPSLRAWCFALVSAGLACRELCSVAGNVLPLRGQFLFCARRQHTATSQATFSSTTAVN